MKTKIGVRILPREVILDTQGRAVEQTLGRTGVKNVHVRVGRYVELDFDSAESEALQQAREIAQSLLHNPLIEVFQLEVVKAGAAAK